ncbi:hypothetical protein FOA43_003756 [Brettanomyces nanus]|uniref:Uncharacterized protein n=1 Tax=Eeniella nana TaxID=13502 RepID=A0A875S5Z2_EENNA|nr:uncharacterized protein FOA43_003756 [Brettanomyces nanus]QPG76368.1 hypothetical protein FOA43_003756 [Brettanomyces nanus]
MRFAILGPPRSSKSSILSIVSNDKSIENYYPTLQNSPTLIQFQPKSAIARALVDVNVTLSDLEQANISENPEYQLTTRILESVADASGLVSAGDDMANRSTHSILKKTLNFYDLDYTRPNYFSTEMISNLSPVSSPIASYSIDSGSGMARPYFSSVMDGGHMDGSPTSSSSTSYIAPVCTPILMEVIDTPGVQSNDLIPFLEKGLDSRLASDVLRNLLNEASTGSRSRVKPLITGSGMSELNAAMDGYLLCYSCIPETAEEVSPPSYDDATSSRVKSTSSKLPSNGCEPIEILKALYTAIMEAWKQYTTFRMGWQEGEEFDVYSLNYSFKHLWRKRATSKDLSDKAITQKAKEMMPPILIAVTHVDHALASPVLIEEGRKLAELWGCGFIKVSCEYENWRNVEEAFSFLVRDRLEDLKLKKSHRKAA